MKVSLITGASGGMGAEFAKKLASENHNLFLVARNENKLKALCAELNAKHNIQAQYFALDLAVADADKILFEETQKRNLDVEWLINNAGIGSGGDLLKYDLDFYKNMMQLNMVTLVALTYRFLPQMRAKKSGTIINLGSVAGFSPIPYMNVYAATKSFVGSFTKALWEENRLYNINVMLLCPGPTDTNFFNAAQIGIDIKSNFTSQKFETPQEVIMSAMKGLKSKKIVTISGTQNKLMITLLSFLPSKFVLKLTGKMMRKNLGIK